MKPDEAEALVAILAASWPAARQNNRETLDVYRRQLERLNADDALVGVDNLVRTSRYWPALAEIVEATRLAAEERVSHETPLALGDGRDHAPRRGDRFVRRYQAAFVDLCAGRLSPGVEFLTVLRQIAVDRGDTPEDVERLDGAIALAERGLVRLANRDITPLLDAKGSPLVGTLAGIAR